MKFTAVPMPVDDMPDFWSRVSKSEHRLLVMDYDGTLAPFHIDPMQAYPLPGIPALLKVLGRTARTTVAVISGRPVQEVATLLGNIGITLVGCHGFEMLDPDGHLTVRSPNRDQLEAMEKAVDVATRMGFEERLEVKTASVALHTRGAPPEKASRIEGMILREWSRIAPSDLGCRTFNGGVEAFCFGWNKGEAFRHILAELPRGAFAVFVGDDATDEDVFLFLRESGVGIKVGTPGDTTAARGFLQDCRAVRAFLGVWLCLMLDERTSEQHGNQKTCRGLEPSADHGHSRR